MLVFFLKTLHGIVNQYNIHLLDAMFLFFIIFVSVLGALVNLVEPYLPNSIRQSMRYGKHSHKGPKDALVSKLEVPKSWFSHFYIFAIVWSTFVLYSLIKSIKTQSGAPAIVLEFLDLLGGGSKNRTANITSSNALVASILLTMQCARRFYETNFVQIFSKSKINLSHYMVGFLHYFAAVLVLLLNTEGFVKGSSPSSFNLAALGLRQYGGLALFLFSWYQQYKANMTFINLRKNPKSGKVETEKHFMPTGGFFDYVSSPHMLFEILMYVALLGFLAETSTWKWVTLWVVSNQVMNALLTHKWYKETYSNYPRKRKALVPYLF